MFEKLEEIFLEEGELEIDNVTEPVAPAEPTEPTEPVTPAEPVETTNPLVEVSEPVVEEPIDTTTEVFNVMRELGIMPEMENPTVELVRQYVEELKDGEKHAANYFAQRPKLFQDLFEYQASLEKPTDDDLIDFFKKYVEVPKVDLETTEGARQFLKSSKEFTSIYDDEDLEEALDNLEDKNKLIPKAQSLYDKSFALQDAQRQAAIEAEKASKLQRQEATRAFYKNVNDELTKLKWSDAEKQATLNAGTAENIGKVWAEVATNPKAFTQFSHLMSRYKDGSFDELFNILEGKATSKQVVEKEKNIVRDSLGNLLGKPKTSKITEDELLDKFQEV